MAKRNCLACDTDLSVETGAVGVTVFVTVKGKPVPVPEDEALLCVQHGTNGQNGMSPATYEYLLHARNLRRYAAACERFNRAGPAVEAADELARQIVNAANDEYDAAFEALREFEKSPGIPKPEYRRNLMTPEENMRDARTTMRSMGVTGV